MSKKLDLHEIRRRAYIAYFQDGLWDILWGLTFAVGGIYATTHQVWVLAMNGLLIVLVTAAKDRFSRPRIGYVKFAAPSREALKWAVAILALPVLLVVAMIIVQATGSYPHGGGVGLRNWILTSLFLLMAFGFAVAAHISGVKRLYVYAGLMVVTGLGDPYSNEPLFQVAYFSMVGVMLFTGIVMFIRFLRKYPLPADEALDVNN